MRSVSVALDMKAISAWSGGGYGLRGIQRSGTPQIGSGGKAKEVLWQRMSTCMDQLHSIVVAVWHLQRVLSKKRDPFPHMLLLDEVMQVMWRPRGKSLNERSSHILEVDPMLIDHVWEALVKSFASQMKSAFTASSFVKEIFTVVYPKLYSMIENLLERISDSFLGPFLSRLSDLVNTVFPVSSRGSVPSKEHISRIISRIQEEIEVVQPNRRLTLLALREISKVLLCLLRELNTSQMKFAFTASSFVKEIFTVVYPKLYSMIENFLERISGDTNVKGVLPTITSEGKDQMVAAIEIFQTAFLGPS
ncbi:hypothetical protein TEA_012443 [Camellia sinensis var. sinensis]|uniref:Conserved oligomeric Golgi complex subunit 5 helical domain-containing protein n=1 Tax=Camellia sinensis var. sinensis TaxID=542762 RepID=A0A4S4EPR6_CAMSN|nr:hypothetical protein TEA_012443 [Camellia sinensis var. sinensis]